MARRARWLTAGAAILALAISGCANPFSRGEPEPSLTPTAVTDGAPGGTAAPPPPPDDSGFSWVPFGPADPNNPDGSGWYTSLEERNCESVRRAGASLGSGDPLALAAAAVCAAAINGDETQWDVARQQAARPRQRPTGCLQSAAEAFVARALAWHERHPGEKPALTFPGPGDPVACAFEITSVRAVNERNEDIGPAQGPVTGGTRVKITGSGLNQVTAVYFGRRPAQNIDQFGGIIVTAPAAEAPGPVDIRVRNRAGEAVAPLAFTYLRDGGGSPSPSTPDSPHPPSPEEPEEPEEPESPLPETS